MGVLATRPEGAILVPLVILLTIALFALVGGWAWSDPGSSNRPAKVGLVCGFLNGVLIARLKLPDFIVTLGTLRAR